MTVLQAKSSAIIAGLVKRGVPEGLVTSAGACPSTFLPMLIQDLVAMLQGCVPAAKTPDGFLQVCQHPGLGVRLAMARQLRNSIREEYGTDADGRHMMNVLWAPAKEEMLAQMQSMTATDSEQMLKEVSRGTVDD